MIRLLPWAGWPIAAILMWAWLGARDAIIEERTGCDAATIQATLDAERLSHAAIIKGYEQTIIDVVSIAEQARRSTEIANEAETAAQAVSATHQQTITRLELEASIDEIPDSGDCLNVFALERSVSGLRRAANCPDTDPASGDRADQLCGGSQGADAADTAGAYFANITYGDALKLWGIDRATIDTLNGQLAAIESLRKDDQ